MQKFWSQTRIGRLCFSSRLFCLISASDVSNVLKMTAPRRKAPLFFGLPVLIDPARIKGRLQAPTAHFLVVLSLVRLLSLSIFFIMANAFFILSILLISFNSIFGQSTAPTPMTTTVPENFDASIGGKAGNPGAQIRVSTKTLDAVYAHALDMIARALRAMHVPDVIVPIGSGMLTIKSTRITEAKLPSYDRKVMPPNRIRSHIYNARLVSIGEWQYKPYGGARSIAQGIFRTVVVNADLNVTNQLARTWDAKPTVQTHECKANLGQFHVEIEGFGENTTVIDQCNNLLCQRIKSYFEDAVCNTVRNYIKETVNQLLSTFPTRTNLGPTGNRFVLNYDLLVGEPKITDQFVQAYLEGEILTRGVGTNPFGANEMTSSYDRDRMISFPLGDYAFNTLLYHAHNQQFRFSAQDLVQSSNVKDSLKLNCSSPADTRRMKSVSISSGLSVTTRGPLCLGSVFDNAAIQYPTNATGDLVFKSQRPLSVIVQQQQKSYFGTTSGEIEAYGPIGNDGKRELLGRADVEFLRGDFHPAIDGCNITGYVNVTDLKLDQCNPPPVQARIRSISDTVLSKLTQLSIPILREMFNAFLDQYAQFPIPLVEGFECWSPEFRWTQRTMQVDCDVRAIPEANRKNKKN